MRNFEITFLEYAEKKLGTGITKIETEREMTEEKAIYSFLKRKMSTGQIVVFKKISFVPSKEKMY